MLAGLVALGLGVSIEGVTQESLNEASVDLLLLGILGTGLPFGLPVHHRASDRPATRGAGRPEAWPVNNEKITRKKLHALQDDACRRGKKQLAAQEA